MDCKRASDLTMKYFDNELKDVEKMELNSHMEECTSCRLEFQWMQEAFSGIEGLPDFEAPKDLEFEIMGKIDKELYRRQQCTKRLWMIPLFALLMGICSAGWYLQYGSVTQESGLDYFISIAKMLNMRDFLYSLLAALGTSIGTIVRSSIKFLEAFSNLLIGEIESYFMLMTLLVSIFIVTQYALVKLTGEHCYKGGQIDEK